MERFHRAKAQEQKDFQGAVLRSRHAIIALRQGGLAKPLGGAVAAKMRELAAQSNNRFGFPIFAWPGTCIFKQMAPLVRNIWRSLQ